MIKERVNNKCGRIHVDIALYLMSIMENIVKGTMIIVLSVPGDTITTVSELLEQEWVICRTSTKHIEVIKNMSLRTVLMFLNNGSIKKAIKIESEE